MTPCRVADTYRRFGVTYVCSFKEERFQKNLQFLILGRFCFLIAILLRIKSSSMLTLFLLVNEGAVVRDRTSRLYKEGS